MKFILILFIEVIFAYQMTCIDANGVNALAGIGIAREMLKNDEIVSNIVENSNWTETLISNIAQLIELNTELEQILKDDPTTDTEDVSAINQVLEIALDQMCSLIKSIAPVLENFTCSVNQLRLLNIKLKMLKVVSNIPTYGKQVNRCKWLNETIHQATNPTEKMTKLQTYFRNNTILNCLR